MTPWLHSEQRLLGNFTEYGLAISADDVASVFLQLKSTNQKKKLKTHSISLFAQFLICTYSTLLLRQNNVSLLFMQSNTSSASC